MNATQRITPLPALLALFLLGACGGPEAGGGSAAEEARGAGAGGEAGAGADTGAGTGADTGADTGAGGEDAAEASRPPLTEAPPAEVSVVPADADRSPSGIATRQLRAGKDPAHPGPEDEVVMHYVGWTTDGRCFDSTVGRREPAVRPMAELVPGLAEAVRGMTRGERRRVWIPESLAYQGRPGMPQGMVVFDVELISFRAVTPAPPPPPVEAYTPRPATDATPIQTLAPPDVAAPPSNATLLPSGLATRVLRLGVGTVRPGPTSRVTVHYSGWNASGQLFDSSIQRGQPASFPLNGVIPGWSEGLQLMVVGEQRRFWIPESLAYPGRSGPLQGMLVFDVELISIQ